MLSLYNVLGNKIRCKLLVCLSHGAKNVSELIGNCRMSQSAVSQHLAKLRASGLVSTTKKGKEIYYKLNFRKSAVIGRSLLDLESEVQ